MTNLHNLEKEIGYTFKDISILKSALTHRSYLNESSGEATVCNERMEFLGDAVLQLTVSHYIYKNYPQLTEGKMSQIRSVVVCESGLFEIAKKLNLGKYILMAHGEELSGGREKPSILSDAMEATVAAIYLDSDFNTVQNFVISLFKEYIVSAVKNNKSDLDYKSRLQEFATAKNGRIDYKIIDESGPDHAKIYTAEVRYNEKITAQGTGSGKKRAEQEAAKFLLEKLKNMNI